MKYFSRFFIQYYEKTGSYGRMNNFSVFYRAFDASNIIDIHKSLMKKHDIE